MSQSESASDDESLYERLGGAYRIAGAVDMLTERLFENDTANHKHRDESWDAP